MDRNSSENKYRSILISQLDDNQRAMLRDMEKEKVYVRRETVKDFADRLPDGGNGYTRVTHGIIDMGYTDDREKSRLSGHCSQLISAGKLDVIRLDYRITFVKVVDLERVINKYMEDRPEYTIKSKKVAKKA